MARRSPRSLRGKVVFITGGARGIGRATAAALVAEGTLVVIGDLDGALADATAAEFGVRALHVDVTDHAAFTRALDEVERDIGPLDVLINNAGVMPIGRFAGTDESAAYRTFEINVLALMHGTREAIVRMTARRAGHIVNVASMAGVVPTPGAAIYSASKHAVVGFCESLWWELRGTGVDLSYLLPTMVNTDLAADIQRTHATNIVEPEAVAAAIVRTLKLPQLAVYVPRSMAGVVKASGLLPRAIGNRIMTATGSDHVVLDSLGGSGRREYEVRVAASAPAADARRSSR